MIRGKKSCCMPMETAIRSVLVVTVPWNANMRLIVIDAGKNLGGRISRKFKLCMRHAFVEIRNSSMACIGLDYLKKKSIIVRK